MSSRVSDAAPAEPSTTIAEDLAAFTVGLTLDAVPTQAVHFAKALTVKTNIKAGRPMESVSLN